MTIITIIPLQGIDIAGVGRIDLGQSIFELKKYLGLPGEHSDNRRLVYPDYECTISFDQSKTVEFIEFISGPFPQRIQLSLYGIDPFQVGADNLVALLSERNAGPVDDSGAGYCYSFLNISVGIWRQGTEEDLQEWVEEKKENGEYEIDRTWIEEEVAKSKNFWTIGIGKPGYYTRSRDGENDLPGITIQWPM